jgi:hypothetical protein
MSGYPVSLTREMQRTDELREAIAYWRDSHGEARGRDRRYAMRLLVAERLRRAARRAKLAAAVNRAAMRRAA